MRTRFFVSAPLYAVVLFSMSACTMGGSTDITHVKTPTNAPQQPNLPGSPAPGPLGGNGTVTSGGGNGVDGSAVELRAVNIENLPEFKSLVLPTLRKMSAGQPDVLVAYLMWTVRQKAWYFIPYSLDTLPQQKTHLSFRSDQLAIHTEREIFIDANAYQKTSLKARATLLLHEMVMGARLLMKKPARAQCESLSMSSDLDVCTDPKMLKMAKDPILDPSEDVHTLNGLDHESVRTMTLLLLNDQQDLSGRAVASARARLGFPFPWESSISWLNLADLVAIIERAAVAEQSFESNVDNFANQDLPQAERAKQNCVLRLTQYDGSLPTYGIDFTLADHLPSPFPAQPSFYHTTSGSSSVITIGKHGKWLENSQVYLPVDSSDTNNSNLVVNARGVVDPFGSEQIVDMLAINDKWMYWQNEGEAIRYEFYISRGSEPTLIGYRLIPIKKMVHKTTKQTSFGEFTSEEMEFVKIQSKKPIECHWIQ
jgi:hypothetical protein